MNRLPPFAANHLTNGRRTHIEQAGNPSLNRATSHEKANTRNVGTRQFCFGVLIAMHIPPLRDHVVHIVGMCSEKKMIRANARWIVATVKHLQSIRNWSVVNLPRNPMRPGVPSAPSGHPSVPERPRRRSPHPASFGLLDMWPEPIRNRARRRPIAMPLNVLNRLSTHIPSGSSILCGKWRRLATSTLAQSGWVQFVRFLACDWGTIVVHHRLLSVGAKVRVVRATPGHSLPLLYQTWPPQSACQNQREEDQDVRDDDTLVDP